MIRGPSEVARILGVDRDQIKTWSYHFSEQLNDSANPSKGRPRQFTDADVLALEYIAGHWEEDPDMEYIEAGLNAQEHMDDPSEVFLMTITPLFQEPPEELDETWRHGALLGGMADLAYGNFELAESYKTAADILISSIPNDFEAFELIYPIVYNYRHAAELYLKAILDTDRKVHDLEKLKVHDLEKLLKEFCERVKTVHKADVPGWIIDFVTELHNFDPLSTTFRYGEVGVFCRKTGDGGEFWIDLVHLKRKMGWLADAFSRIRRAATAGTTASKA